MNPEKNVIQAAVDTALSGVSRNPMLHRSILDASKGDVPPVKKKLTLSLALVLVLALVAASAAVAGAYHGISYFLTEKSAQPVPINEDYVLNNIRQHYHNSEHLDASVVDAYWDGVSFFIACRIRPADPAQTLGIQCLNLYHNHDAVTTSADILVQEPSFIMITDVNGDVRHAAQYSGQTLSYDWVQETDGSVTIMVRFPLYSMENIKSISVPLYYFLDGSDQRYESYLHSHPSTLADPIADHVHIWEDTTSIGPKICTICQRTSGGSRQYHNSNLLDAAVIDAAWDGLTFTITYRLRAADPSQTLQVHCIDPQHIHEQARADAAVHLQEPAFVMITEHNNIVRHAIAECQPNGTMTHEWTYENDGSVIAKVHFPLQSMDNIKSLAVPIYASTANDDSYIIAFLHFHPPVMEDPIPPHDHIWEEATCVSPKTCSICRRTEGGLGYHNFLPEEGNAAPTRTCPVCTTTQEAPSSILSSFTLRPGDYTNHVWLLQTRLHALGYYNGLFSGYYSEDVQAAVTAFQQDTNLTADGICRPDTLAKLFPTE